MSPKTRATLRALMGATPTAVQVAALCQRGPDVLLITSRDTGRWVLPKGWPMRRRPPHAAAAIEAWQEAGVRGRVRRAPLGTFCATKAFWPGLSCPVQIHVFPLDVASVADTYPEAGQRRRLWLPPQDAADLVAEPDLAALLRSLPAA